MKDLDGNILMKGDMVQALRYELGVCRILEDEKGFLYESLETNKQVSWIKMVDATTKFQKVRKIEKSPSA
jgi:hypothetical protein